MTTIFSQRILRRSACLAFALTLPQAALAADDGSAIVQLVRQHLLAQRNFDQPALMTLTTDDYVEVSPLGEVDDREKMLGFYNADKKTAAPLVTLDEPTVRVTGDHAVLIGKLAMQVTAGGQSRDIAMRATYVAQKDQAQWKLLSVHYAPIMPKRPAAQ